MRSDRDPELEELFTDGELRDTAWLLRSVPHPTADPDPAFRAALRRRLMTEAWDLTQPQLPWYRRLLGSRAPRGPILTMPMFAGLAGAVGIVLIAFVAITLSTSHMGTTTTVTANSPLDNAQAVGLKTPIVINFSQQVDPSTVHVEIQPATQAREQWQGSSLKIIPVNDLAPNTQYQVQVTHAKAEPGQSVAPKKVVFSTAPPPPTPTPVATPTPKPNGPAVQPEIVNQRQLVAGGTASSWAADGGKLYVIGNGGQLQTVPVAGGDPQTVQPDGVSVVASGPDGVAYARGGQVVYGQTSLANVQPVALGFRSGKLLVATSRNVIAADHSTLAKLSEDAQAAAFSPDGNRLAYLGASGLHLVDLGSGADKVAGPARSLGHWSPDGRRYAYATDTGVAVTDGSTGSALVDLSGVTGISWSRSDQVLLATGSSLYVVNGDASGLRKLADGSFGQPEWSPSGSIFSFKRSAGVWVGQVAGTRPSPPPQGQDATVNAFMAARKAQQSDQAMGFLDAAGRSAFANGGLKLTYPDGVLARYYILFSQPNREVIRLVLNDGTALDETLTLATEPATDRWLIHGASETAPRPFDKGPEVLSVTVSGNQVRVAFDSDLDAGSATSSVRLKGMSSQASYDAKSRTVTVTLADGLTAGTEYRLVVSSDLEDVNQQHPAATFELPFTAA